MAELTPTKSISRPSVSPKCKASVCFICLENVDNPHYRRKLFLKSEYHARDPLRACVYVLCLHSAIANQYACGQQTHTRFVEFFYLIRF